MQIIFKIIAVLFIVFLTACFVFALKKEIKKFKAFRKCVGKPVSSRETLIYVIILITPFILFFLYKYKSTLFLMLQ